MFNQTNFPKTSKIISHLKEEIDKAGKEVSNFKDRLDSDPENALIWSEKVFATVAKTRVMKLPLMGFEAWKSAYEQGQLSDAQPKNDEEVVEFIKSTLLRETLRRAETIQHSTSVTATLLENYKTVALATLLRYITEDML